MLPSYLTLIKSQWIPTKHYRFPWIQRWSNLYPDKDSGKSGLKLCLENDDSGASNSLSDLYSMQGTICYLRTDLWTNKQINKWRAKNKLHTNKKHMETFKTIPFTTALKKMKYLCRKCKKKKWYRLYHGNYKMQVEEIKDDPNKWGDISCPWIGWFNVVKMPILPKLIYRFNTIPEFQPGVS